MPSYPQQLPRPLPPHKIPQTDHRSQLHDVRQPGIIGTEGGGDVRFRPLRPAHWASDRPIKQPPTELPSPVPMGDATTSATENAYTGYPRMNARAISLASTSSSRSSVASSRSTTSSMASSHTAYQHNHASFGSATSVEEAVSSLFDFKDTFDAIDELDANEYETDQPHVYSPQQSKTLQHQSLQGYPVHRARQAERPSSEPPKVAKVSSPADAIARNRKREAAVKEIFTTERTYVDGLRKLVKYFLIPLRENHQKKNVLLSTKPVASLEDIATMFGIIEQILQLHEQLLNSLESRYQSWSPTQKISDIFLHIAPYLKMYTTYLKNFPQAISTMERLRKESQSFKKFLSHCNEKPELGGLAMNAFLILPVQRIPRYKLLLESLLKYTDESHCDYADIQKCVRQISAIADGVNEKIRDAENQQKVVEVQNQVEGLPENIVKPARRFIYKGDLFKVMPNKFSNQSRSFSSTQDVRAHYLFNDLLLFCVSIQGKEIYKGQIDLAFARLNIIEESHADKPNCFQIITKTQDGEEMGHSVRASTPEERDEWVNKIESAISKLQNGIRQSYNAEGSHLIPIQQSQVSLSAAVMAPTSPPPKQVAPTRSSMTVGQKPSYNQQHQHRHHQHQHHHHQHHHHQHRQQRHDQGYYPPHTSHPPRDVQPANDAFYAQPEQMMPSKRERNKRPSSVSTASSTESSASITAQSTKGHGKRDKSAKIPYDLLVSGGVESPFW